MDLVPEATHLPTHHDDGDDDDDDGDDDDDDSAVQCLHFFEISRSKPERQVDCHCKNQGQERQGVS